MSGRKSNSAKARTPQKPSIAERAADLKTSLAHPRGRRAKPDATVVPAAQSTGITADLAEACFRMAERWNWLDIAGNTDGMSDEAWDAEFARQKVVWARAISEPSIRLRDLAAKAGLLRDDFDRFYPEANYNSDNFRLLRVVLREAADLAPAPYPIAGGLLADLHAMTGGVHHGEGTVASSTIVDRINFASATMTELLAFHDLADRVGGVAYALAWSGRCQAHGPGDNLNAVGDLMHWLGDALTEVESAAIKEARRRVPVDRLERETRLQILAAPVIQNGDPDETAAFARELADHAAAEAARA